MRPVFRQRARQWSRAAWALALLFGSLPVSSRLFLGVWGFEAASGVAGLCLFVGAYLHILSARAGAAVPDPANLLDEALQCARAGDVEQAGRLLTQAIELTPRLWQAYQYRGELYLAANQLDLALQDFSEAIRIQPAEPHLYLMRAHTHRLMNDEPACRLDIEAATALGGVVQPPH